MSVSYVSPGNIHLDEHHDYQDNDSIDHELDWLIAKEGNQIDEHKTSDEYSRPDSRSGGPQKARGRVKSAGPAGRRDKTNIPQNRVKSSPGRGRSHGNESMDTDANNFDDLSSDSDQILSDNDLDFSNDETLDRNHSEVSAPMERQESTDDGSDVDEYNMTDDQRKAMHELDRIKQEMDYAGEEEPPEYDVTERLKKLNAELATVPSPKEEDREQKIHFKDNVVDLVVPPPEFSEDEEDKKKVGESKSGETQPSEEEMDTNKQRTTGNSIESSKSDDEKVLVERDGKYELVSVKDLEAEQLQAARRSKHKPAPPSKPRPATANGNMRRSKKTVQPRRAESVNRSRSPDIPPCDYNSPYALTPEQKKQKEKQDREKEEKEKDEKKRKQQEEEEKRQLNEEAFSAWLRIKLQSNKNKREEDKTKEEPEKEKEEREAAFESWLKYKREQQQREKDMEKEREREIKENSPRHPPDECEKAYKQWLKKKNAELRKSKTASKHQVRYQRLLARRSRKSQAMLRAARQSQSFRYVDYYNYDKN